MRQTYGFSHRSSAKPIPTSWDKLAALFPRAKIEVRYSYKRKLPEQERRISKFLPSCFEVRGFFVPRTIEQSPAGVEDFRFQNPLELKKQADSVLLLREAQESTDIAYQQRVFEYVCELETTFIAEVLEGQMRSRFEFVVKGGEIFLLAKEGPIHWLELHKNGVDYAHERAAQNAALKPYIEIAELELERAELVAELVKKGEPFTMTSLSLCGDDVFSREDLESIGRFPDKQRAMFWDTVFDGDTLTLETSSVDGMSVEEGRRFMREEVGATVSDYASSIDILRALSVKEGINHGITRKVIPEQGTDTYQFVLKHEDLLLAHIQSLELLAASSELPLDVLASYSTELRYDIFSSYKQRLNGTWVDMGNLADSVSNGGNVERQQGTQYYGCDTVVSSTTIGSKLGSVAGEQISAYQRAKDVEDLQKPKQNGKCQACGVETLLYGCGDGGTFCIGCNRVWCSEYRRSGKQLSFDEVRKMSSGKSKDREITDSQQESLASYINRLGEEIRQKNLEKLKEERTAKLRRKAEHEARQAAAANN